MQNSKKMAKTRGKSYVSVVTFDKIEDNRKQWQLERDVQAEIQARVSRNATKLLNAQMNIAEGCTFLYVKRKNKKGELGQAELIEDQETIRAFVDGELSGGDDYYYISTQRPENNAINSLFDRAFGKPVQKTELTGAGGTPLLQPDRVLIATMGILVDSYFGAKESKELTSGYKLA